MDESLKTPLKVDRNEKTRHSFSAIQAWGWPLVLSFPAISLRMVSLVFLSDLASFQELLVIGESCSHMHARDFRKLVNSL